MSKDHQTGTGKEEAPKHEAGANHQDKGTLISYPLPDPARYLAYLQKLAALEVGP